MADTLLGFQISQNIFAGLEILPFWVFLFEFCLLIHGKSLAIEFEVCTESALLLHRRRRSVPSGPRLASPFPSIKNSRLFFPCFEGFTEYVVFTALRPAKYHCKKISKEKNTVKINLVKEKLL